MIMAVVMSTSLNAGPAIAFGDLLLDDSAQCGGLHIHRATRHGLAGRHFFATDIHHARPTLGIHMRPF